MRTPVEPIGGGKIRREVPLAPLTTYKVGGRARWMIDVDDEEEAIAAASLAAREGVPVLVLGRGSNLVVSDRGFDGVVIRPGTGMSWREVGEDGVVTAGAGCPLPVLARETARHGRSGLEFFAGIPGSVGGAVHMNAGCHGSETAEWLVTARLLDLATAEVSERAPSDLEMSYRHSNLGGSDMVISARFRTEQSTRSQAESRIREVTLWRRLHQPGGTLNAGSAFKNPPGDSAGRIIDSLGLKGLAVGAVEVSERHANFFVAGAGATASEIRSLVEEVQRRVEEATGILLEPELRFVGDFG